MPKNVFYFLQILLSVIMTSLILLQGKGSGLGSAFGARISNFSTKRGVEKAIFNLTIIIAILFFLSSVALLIFG